MFWNAGEPIAAEGTPIMFPMPPIPIPRPGPKAPTPIAFSAPICIDIMFCAAPGGGTGCGAPIADTFGYNINTILLKNNRLDYILVG